MPATPSSGRTARWIAAAAASAALVHSGFAAEPETSPLDARLFYQLMIGEMELRAGQAGTAYEVMLDAARRSSNAQLFRRSTEIALQARAGEQALAAAKIWRETLPGSLEAHRFVVQLLLALNRAGETAEPLRALIAATPPAERPDQIIGLARLFGRPADRAQAPALLEQALQPYADAPDTRGAVAVAIGRAWQLAEQPAKALELAQRAHTADPLAEAPVLLALALLPGTPAAEDIVVSHLRQKPDSTAVRLVYVGTLGAAQRFPDALAQLEVVTRANPSLAPPWLTLGALHLELKQPKQAMAAVQKYVQLLQTGAPSAAPRTRAGSDADDDAGEDTENREQALNRAWMLLAQAAEQQGDFKAAETWLARIENPRRLLEVQTRRASILARQGKVAEARALIQRAPEQDAEDARAKVLAEAQLLREGKRWGDANELLAQANQRFPNDVDLLYEQSMMAEKLNRMDEMERLLRRVIAIKPDHQHAYNALGFSLAERNLRLPEAKALIVKALELSPGEPFITDSLGWVEFRLGNVDEALRLLRTAYRARPDPDIAAHLGEVLWVKGERDEARRIWGEARTRDAENDALRETLARLRVDL
jgi:tetratricopeptide (TPR) repeat protein